MEKRKILFGIILVSAIVAAGIGVLNINSSASQERIAPEAATSRLPLLEFSDATYTESLQKEGEVYFTAPSPQSQPLAEQKVIKTSFIWLEVETYSPAAEKVKEIAALYSGYVSSVSVQDYGGRKIGTVVIRVPEEYFQEAISEIETLGDLKKEDISLEDVTEQYIDLKARLENLKQQESRYVEILEMATNVREVLDVENQLERIRGSIESLQGRLNYLENQTTYSSVHVKLSEPDEVVHESKIGEALNRALEAFLGTIRGIIIFLGYFIPIVLFMSILAAVGWLGYHKLLKRDQ